MRLLDHLHEKLIFCGLEPLDKKDLLEKIARNTARRQTGVKKRDLFEKLKAREEQGSTGIGRGVALPHAMVDGIKEPVCAMAQIPRGVDFGSSDGLPVRFVFLVLSPPDRPGKHIKMLARIARLVKNDAFLNDVIRASSAAEILIRVLREDEGHVT